MIDTLTSFFTQTDRSNWRMVARWILLLVMLGLILAFSPLGGAHAAPSTAPSNTAPDVYPNDYLFVDWTNAVDSGTLDRTFLNSKCNDIITATVPANGLNQWYALGPTAGSWRHDYPYGPHDGLLYSDVGPNNPVWYRTALGGDYNSGHPERVNGANWSQSNW